MIALVKGILKDLTPAEGLRELEHGEVQIFKFGLGMLCKQEAQEGEEESYEFQCSSEAVDRHGDIVVQNFVLDAFDKESPAYNPVFLWQHNRNLGPIGRIDGFTATNPLKAKVVPMPKGIDALADMLWKKVDLGFLRMVSVSFIPKAWEPIYEGEGNKRQVTGFKYTKNELLEVSLVSIPANPFAGLSPKALDEDHEDHAVIEPEPIKATGFKMFTTGLRQGKEIQNG